jgi:hypothetical protein
MDDCWAPLPLADLDVEDGPKIRDLEDMIEETMYWMDRYRSAGQGEPVLLPDRGGITVLTVNRAIPCRP